MTISRRRQAAYAALRALDDEWMAILATLAIRVTRDRESYVSYDGAGTLNVAPDDELDADDCFAQIVLHELCHHWGQGNGSLREPDWGLDNLTGDDDWKEHAALRLQALVCDQYGLRDVLVPTTDFRSFYEALGPEPLAGASERERAYVLAAWERYRESVVRDAVERGLTRVVLRWSETSGE